MGNVENIIKASQLQMEASKDFANGMKSLMQGLATNDATKKIAQINAEVTDETERVKQSQMVGQDLAMRLTGAGMGANEVGAATQGLVPSANNTQTMKAQADMQKQSQQHDYNQAERKFDHDKELQQDRLDAMGFKDAKKDKKVMAGFADKFRKENADTLNSRDKISAIRHLLDVTPDRVAVEMAKTGVLKFSGEDRISDADIIRGQTDPSYRATIARRLKVEMTGEALADDRKFYKMILDEATKTMDKTLKTKVKGYATGTAELADIDADQLESGLRKQLNLKDDEPSAKTLKNKLFSPKANKTKLIYSDGTEEVVDGQR